MTARRFVASGPDSPLEGVSSTAWQRFIVALEVQPVGAVSVSGGLGTYDIRPRRLVELEYATNLRRPMINGRPVQACDFALPWTQSRFLADPIAQYTVLARSMRSYYDAIRLGKLEKPEGVSMAGALAILHIGGRAALKSWPQLFTHTKALYDAAQGAF